ncbi:hypothetical protein APSETT445_003789 [Aspergillus pseudonomiae]
MRYVFSVIESNDRELTCGLQSSTDNPSFDLWLVNMRHFPNYARRIDQGINRDAQSYRVQGVSGVPAKYVHVLLLSLRDQFTNSNSDGYQFNFVRRNADETEAKERPLAQSKDFIVTSAGII